MYGLIEQTAERLIESKSNWVSSSSATVAAARRGRGENRDLSM